MHVELFDARMLSPLVHFVERNGDRATSLLDRSRIPDELVHTGGWIAKKQAYDFTLHVVQRSRCRDVVFDAYQNFQLELLGPIADAMRWCKTVKEALEVGARLGSVAFEGNEYFLQVEGELAWFCYREPRIVSAGQTFINDMTLAVYCQIIRAVLSDDQWRPRELRTRGEGNDRHLHSAVFANCRAVAHAHATGLALPTRLLSRRLRWPEQAIDSSALHDWDLGPQDSSSTAEKLYRLIASCFPYRSLPTLDEVGRMVGLSPRTLKRHLAAAGTSYRGLLDRLRFDEACRMLAEPRMTVGEIANELGFSGTNNFVRSFRRMTGVTPQRYRTQGS